MRRYLNQSLTSEHRHEHLAAEGQQHSQEHYSGAESERQRSDCVNRFIAYQLRHQHGPKGHQDYVTKPHRPITSGKTQSEESDLESRMQLHLENRPQLRRLEFMVFFGSLQMFPQICIATTSQ